MEASAKREGERDVGGREKERGEVGIGGKVLENYE